MRPGQPGADRRWIIYPFLAWALLTAAGAWFAYRRRQVSEEDIRREVERQHQ